MSLKHLLHSLIGELTQAYRNRLLELSQGCGNLPHLQ